MKTNILDILDLQRVLLNTTENNQGYIPKSIERVAKNTSEKLNKKILNKTIENLNYYKDKDEFIITKRIGELEKEWDVERLLEGNAATLILIGLILGSTIDKKWYLLSGGVAAFLLQHSLQGWCPPLPILRAMGKRTPYEIFSEIIALKILRGDLKIKF